MNEAGARVCFRASSNTCVKLIDSGFQYYVCGAGKIAVGVKSTLTEFIRSSRGCSVEEADAAFDLICKGRFATDIFE
jgi:sulfite reductase alpha subunit-like flavoprotein